MADALAERLLWRLAAPVHPRRRELMSQLGAFESPPRVSSATTRVGSSPQTVYLLSGGRRRMAPTVALEQLDRDPLGTLTGLRHDRPLDGRADQRAALIEGEVIPVGGGGNAHRPARAA